MPARTRRKPLFKLASPMVPERRDKAVMERDNAPRLAALGFNELELAADAGKGLSDGDGPFLKVNIGPSKPQQFPAPKAATYRDKVSRFERFAFDCFQEPGGFAWLPRFYFGPLPSWSINQLRHVAGAKAILYRLFQRAAQNDNRELNRARRQAIFELPLDESADVLRRNPALVDVVSDVQSPMRVFVSAAGRA